MTRYFMRFTPLFAAEVQMMTPPRHQPRGMTLGEITIQPEEAELVRFIFQRYSTGARWVS